MLLLERVLPNPYPARTIRFAETLSDRIDPIPDVDLFTFDGLAGSSVAITASRTDGTNIYFEPCVLLWAPDSVQWADFAPGGTHTVQLTLPLTGSYTVGVTDYTADNSGDYTVTLACLGGPCAANQTTLAVPAGAPWVDSGITLSGGQLVAMYATASWQTNPAGPVAGPMGVAEPCPSCPINANRGALLARIGSNPPFFAGDAFSFTVNAAWSGRLQYQINDDVFGDNTGSATVHAIYSTPPLGVGPTGTVLSDMLAEAAPNPFAESTRLRFTVSRSSRVSVRVFDMAGRLVRTLLSETPLEAGEHFIDWNGRGDDGMRQAPGVYLYSLRIEGREHARRAILLR
jgi:hypothetical protein